MLKLPEAFINSVQNTKGFNKVAFEKVHQSGEQVTSIRLNPLKYQITGKVTQRETDNEQQETRNEKIPWSSNGYYLSSRPSFTADPLFHAGAYYVQEASSMFLEEALKQTADLSAPLKILDLCAAPGGKSTLIQSLISNKSLLVSNEVIRTRVNILSENIIKWGAANVIVTNNDPGDFKKLPDFFDVIVVDAPCSGSGLFRKDPDAVSEWSEQNVQLCSRRQQRILAEILPSLKEGGILIYSTCSYSEEEDEQIADWLVEESEAESLRLKMEDSWNIVETVSAKHNCYGYRFYPGKIKGEGFFIAAFKKPGQNNLQDRKFRGKSIKLSAKEIEIVKPFLDNQSDLLFIKQKDEVIALPQHFENALAAVQSCLYIKKAGVKLGAIIRDELIPDHELALSAIANPGLPAIEADIAVALQYLRKQEIQIETAVKGWALIAYKNLPLGWVKILSNRINNYYPKEWRILNK